MNHKSGILAETAAMPGDPAYWARFKNFKGKFALVSAVIWGQEHVDAYCGGNADEVYAICKILKVSKGTRHHQPHGTVLFNNEGEYCLSKDELFELDDKGLLLGQFSIYLCVGIFLGCFMQYCVCVFRLLPSCLRLVKKFDRER